MHRPSSPAVAEHGFAAPRASPAWVVVVRRFGLIALLVLISIAGTFAAAAAHAANASVNANTSPKSIYGIVRKP